jgi:hypothetical protein
MSEVTRLLDAAAALGMARRTADRQWAFARAWLSDAIGTD